MTTRTHPEPIRLPVVIDPGSPVRHVEITPDISRRIVAIAMGDAVSADIAWKANSESWAGKTEARIAALEGSNNCRIAEILDCHNRIAALEARAQSQDRVDDTIGALLMPPPVKVPPGQRSRNPILDNYTQHAAPDADEVAAVEALLAAKGPDGQELRAYMSCCAAFSKQDIMGWAIAAIRKGEVPTILPENMMHALVSKETAAKIAAQRDQLRAANAGREAAAEEYRRQIAEMSAKLDEAKASAADYKDQRDTWYDRHQTVAAQVAELTRLNEATRIEGIKLAGDLTKRVAEVAELTMEAERRVQGNAESRRVLLESERTALAARDKALADLAAEREKVKRYDAHLAPKHDDKCEALADIRDGFDRIRDCTCFVPRAEVERLKADIAAERAKYDALHVGVSDVLNVEGYTDASGLIAGGRAVVADLAAANERAEKAERESDHNFLAGAAARREADAAKAEVETAKGKLRHACEIMATLGNPGLKDVLLEMHAYLFPEGAAVRAIAGNAAPRRQWAIIGPDGIVHYRRPEGHKDLDEARAVPGYRVVPVDSPEHAEAVRLQAERATSDDTRIAATEKKL